MLSTLAADKTSSVLAGLGRAPSRAEQANALLDGFQVAFVAAALLVAVGALLLMVLVRRADVAGINPDAAPVPGA